VQKHDDTDWEREAITNPVNRFAHLPEPTRKWLEQLREDDLSDLNEAVRFYHNIKTVGRFNKWLIITVVASFVVAVQFGEAIQKAFNWIVRSGSGHP
jgi:hypothetical protein